MVNRTIVLLFTPLLLLGSESLFPELAPDNALEAQLVQTMLIDAYKGKWHPMSNKSVPFEGFKLKGGQMIEDGKEHPFTGWYGQFDEADEPRMLCSFYEGVKNGFIYLWDENGTRRFQGEMVDNQRHGEFIEWNAQAIRTSQKNYKANKLHGECLIWYDSGKIKLEATFEEGNLVDARGWYPDGTPCPYSRVIKGRGIILSYEAGYQPEKEKSKGVLYNTFRRLEDWREKMNPLDQLDPDQVR